MTISQSAAVFGPRRLAVRDQRILGIAAFLLVLELVGAAGLSGQTVMVIADDVSCAQCSIDLEHMTQLGGDADTLVNIGYTATLPIDSRGRIYFSAAEFPGSIKVFDPDGRLISEIGRSGEGPGEFISSTLTYVKRGDSLYAFDMGTRRLTVFSPQYDVVRTGAVQVIPVDGFFDEQGYMTVSSIGRSPASFGYPLHRLSGDGELLHSFGGDYSGISRRNRSLLGRSISPRETGGLWAAHKLNYDIEEYDRSGNHVRTVRRRPSWFPDTAVEPLLPSSPSDPPPFAQIYGVQEDDAGMLWVLVWLPASDWRDALAEENPPPTAFWDTVIEVIDPRSGRVITRRRIDATALGFSADGVFFTYDDRELYPRIDLWRFRLSSE